MISPLNESSVFLDDQYQPAAGTISCMEAIRALGTSCEKNSIKKVTILIFRVINSNLAGHKKPLTWFGAAGYNCPRHLLDAAVLPTV